MVYNEIEKVLVKYARLIRDRYKNNLKNLNINATNNLARSVKVRIERRNNEFEVELKLAEYWKWVEEGRAPGKMPPIDAIVKWVQVKKAFRSVKGIKAQKSVAFRIARKIGERGTKGRFPLDKTKEELYPLMMKELRIAMDKDISEDLNKIMIELPTNTFKLIKEKLKKE